MNIEHLTDANDSFEFTRAVASNFSHSLRDHAIPSSCNERDNRADATMQQTQHAYLKHGNVTETAVQGRLLIKINIAITETHSSMRMTRVIDAYYKHALNDVKKFIGA